MSAMYPAAAPTRPIPVVRAAEPDWAALVGPVPPRARRRRSPVEVIGLLVVSFLGLGLGVALGLAAIAWALS